MLAIDVAHEDALAFISMADGATGGSTSAESSAPASAAPPPQPDAPSSFAGGRYEVREFEFLGEGGKKRVFLTHDSLLDRDVAFALVRTNGLDDAGRERITREAQAMGRLGDHPHIVPVLDLGEERNSAGVSQPYIASQYIAGGSVEDLLNAEDDLPLERTLEIALGVGRGLDMAHSNKIVHRDLQPGNVWLDEDGTAKIGDFGLVRSRSTAPGSRSRE